MRVWGRVYDVNGNPIRWVEVSTAADGSNDYVYITALIQCLKLTLGESPFFANYGIPGPQSVLTQIAPDYQVAITQQQYAQFFASLIITRVANAPVGQSRPGMQPGPLSLAPGARQAPGPTYNVAILTHQGVRVNINIPV